MKLTCNQGLLQAALRRMVLASGNSTNPILGCTKLEAKKSPEGGSLGFTALNGFVAIHTSIRADVTDPGEVELVNARLAHGAAAALSSGDVAISTTQARLTLKGPSGRHFGLGRMTGELAPIKEPDDAQSLSIAAELLPKLIESVAFALADTPDHHPEQDGLLLEVDESGTRLSAAVSSASLMISRSVEIPKSAPWTGFMSSHFIPLAQDLAQESIKAKVALTLYTDKTMIYGENRWTLIQAMLPVQPPPPWRALLRAFEGVTPIATLPRLMLMETLKAFSAVSSGPDQAGVRIIIELGHLTVSRSDEIVDFEEKIAVDMQVGKAATFFVNANFFFGAIKAAGENPTLKLSDRNMILIETTEGFSGIVGLIDPKRMGVS